jgi:hypothetical protein
MIEEIDWDKFAARVPAGTQVKKHDTPAIINGKPSIIEGDEGILLENKPFRISELSCKMYEYISIETMLYFQPFRHIGQMSDRAEDMRYLIDGAWKTLPEIMA